MLREQPYLDEVRRCTTSDLARRELVDHAPAHVLFRAVYESLQSGLRVSARHLVLHTSQALERLQDQMDVQERSFFPLLGTMASARALREAPLPPIVASMSVNAVLRRYPQTEPVFERFQVNRWREGSETLEELAWWHGVDVSRVLDELLRAAQFPSP
jgi:hypothetical protein